MKAAFWVTALLCIGFVANTGCRKNVLYLGTATIIGYDTRTAACEGGIYIKIDGHPNPNDSINGYYDTQALPANLPLADTTQFPIKVRINWLYNSQCNGNYVDIINIARAD